MKKRLSCIGIVCAMLLCILCGCGKSVEKQLWGTWYEDGDLDSYIEFYEDGTFYDNEFRIKGGWYLEKGGSVIVITVSIFSLDYSLDIEGDSMTLTSDSGNTSCFTRNTVATSEE